LVPTDVGRYHEPFLGGGALFFALRPAQAVLADRNADLINCYLQVRDNPRGVIRCLSKLENSEECYYRIRGTVPGGRAGRAARVIYLTTLSFNGIFRVNQKGEFNVPYGRKTHLQPCDPGRIEAAGVALSSARLVVDDFEKSAATAREGDVVYLDPPYTVAHGNNGFLKYNARIFSWDDQVRLSRLAAKLAARGCKVIVSNADHVSIRRLYPSFECQRVVRPSVIAASAIFRRRITECIFYNEG
jgi:DNA adenine methylase